VVAIATLAVASFSGTDVRHMIADDAKTMKRRKFIAVSSVFESQDYYARSARNSRLNHLDIHRSKSAEWRSDTKRLSGFLNKNMGAPS
jgi:hypothetical protein